VYVLSTFNSRRFRVPFVVAAALLFSALACTLTTGGSTPDTGGELPVAEVTPAVFEPTPTVAETVPDVSFDGVSFSYDDSIASDVTAQLVPEEYWEEGSRPFGGGTVPEHYRFEFVGYAHLPYPMSAAYIEIYPAAEFEAGHPDAAERIAEMRDLLATRPTMPASAVPEVIPLMPLAPLIPAFYGQAQYLDFEGGSGARCLTMFGFAVQPITNSEMRYTFQGMLNDGDYYVAAMLPVSSPILYDDLEQVPEDEARAIMSAEVDWVTYVTDVVAQLDAQSLDSYTPSLSALDAMIQSIVIQDG
jgi:hypothetical protein